MARPRLKDPLDRSLIPLLVLGLVGCASSNAIEPLDPGPSASPAASSAGAALDSGSADSSPTLGSRAGTDGHDGSNGGAESPPPNGVASNGSSTDHVRQTRQPRWGDRYWGVSTGRVVRPLVQPVKSWDVREVGGAVRTATGWVRYREWIGESEVRTQPFTTHSDWKLVWQSAGEGPTGPLEIVAHRVPGDHVVARVSQDRAAETSSLQLPEPGTYYLEIRGSGGAWYVAVDLPQLP